ncbi:hypothetical protein BDV95DRAFT_592730 [Massariosphaeria phaeospora]|uniref:Uncharacterized protein n=1 Tax=Massariosphaeria phaeospora TaxID=100035 RepID=A0A7C8IAF0_9PLEO|nr:hypothetical protein BDV95DRAFT_592730 [Massariosphaeria phaeospora]
MSELDSRFVKRGVWVDVEKGPVMGKTITANTQTGAFAIALLAIFSSLATAHLWHLATFAIHQVRANGRARDALFRQQQAILRTLPTPGALIADSLKLFWHWRSKKGISNALLRISLQVVLAVAFVAMTWAASIFSSLVVDTTNLQVLVSSPFCGFIDQTFENSNDIALTYTTVVDTVVEPFAEDCYLNANESLPARCDALIRPQNLFTTEKVDCPFDSSMCVGNDKPAINIDSGLIDLNEFGLNLQKQDRVQFRKSTTCTVLPTENRTTIISASDFQELNRPALPQEELLLMHYGDVLHYEYWKNATFLWPLTGANTTSKFDVRASFAYGSEELRDNGTQVLLPEMQRDDADISFKMIAKNYIMYRETNEDPVFSAHKTHPIITNMGQTGDRYYSDFPTSVIACSQQFQYCVAQKKGKPICSSLSGLPVTLTHANFPAANDVQLALLQVLMTSSVVFDQTTSKTLDAQAANWDGEITSLPNNQWEKEVIRWEAIAWAGIQSLITDYAIGPSQRDPRVAAYVRPASTPSEKTLCASQKMQKSGNFVNINVFGLSLIISFALVIVTLDIALLKLLVFISGFRRLTGLSSRLNRWTQDGVLQLQRRAYEAQGKGSWVNFDDDVPLTREEEALGDLPVESVSLEGVLVGMGMRMDLGSGDSGRGSGEEVFSPRALRNAKTWATQDTIVACSPMASKESGLKG